MEENSNEVLQEEAVKDHNMTRIGEMPVGRLIVTMSWPAVISMFIQAFYNVVDSFFVSLISEQALAAVTYIFPVQVLIIAFGVGTGVGIKLTYIKKAGSQKI